jgi:hypothetical protein
VAPGFATNSVRFRRSASAYLSRTPATASNRQKFTFSTWLKRGQFSSYQNIFGAGPSGTDRTILLLDGGASGTDNLFFNYQTGSTGYGSFTTSVFRDPSAWYHIVLSVDTTLATAGDRVKIYINGVQQTLNAFTASGGFIPQNTNLNINSTDLHTIGATSSGTYLDGYLTEINFVDGQVLTPNYFGATSVATGAWQPATYRGTYGTNGFYLPMSIAQEGVGAADYLIIAGGGAGGRGVAEAGSGGGGGGGGAGGLLTGTLILSAGVTYSVVVGEGGVASSSGNAGSGGNSTALGLTAIGGGGGADAFGQTGQNGGSGGGNDINHRTAGGSGTTGQGFAGGAGAETRGGAGGGGSASKGVDCVSNGYGSSPGTTGGSSTNSSITGSSVAYAGGGGGGGGGTSGAGGGSGGGGGAGNGGGITLGAGSNATANTGSGGGGGGGGVAGSNTFVTGGNGGKGVVILRLLTSVYTGITTGSPTVTPDGSYTVIKFTSSGSYTA